MGVYFRAMSSGVGYVGLAATLGNTSQLERFLAVAGSRVFPQSMIVPMSKIDALTRPKLSVTKPRCEPFAPFTDVAGLSRGTLAFISVNTTGSNTTHAVQKTMIDLQTNAGYSSTEGVRVRFSAS